jgi:tRNA-splicing ligase RtcB
MSRNEARRRFSVEDHMAATRGVECRKDAEVIDETPMAYKDIDAVMAAQADLVEPVARFDPRLVKMAPEGEKAED